MTIVHARRSIRLPGYDYAQPGAYYVTLVAQGRENHFGEIVDGEMHLNAFGCMVRDGWLSVPHHFPNVTLDEFIIMPNHFHALIMIGPGRGEASASQSPDPSQLVRADASPLRNPSPLRDPRPNGTGPGSLGAIIQNFKSVSTRKINARAGTPDAPLWQRNYYEHILRSDSDLDRVRSYIRFNPLQWQQDPERK